MPHIAYCDVALCLRLVAHSRVAAVVMIKINPVSSILRIGIAGWAIPPDRRSQRRPNCTQLQYYARHFNAVEINSSFYRSHRRATYQRWRAETPSDFEFSVKLPRAITHEAQLRRCRGELTAFLDETSGLGRKLKVILVQLPPSLEFNAAVARRVFSMLRNETRARIVCEPRHTSWFSDNVERSLERYAVSRVAVDPARHRSADVPAGNGSVEYYRLHGSPQMYYSAYTHEYLEALAAKLRESRQPRRKTRIWCIFDNTARYHAWPNARLLQRLFLKAH